MSDDTNEVEKLSSVPQQIWSLEARDIDENLIKMDEFKGCKALLIVNVASKSNYTQGTYKILNNLYNQYQNTGKELEILAFPCNQFDNQEPCLETDIKKFWLANFGVKFPLFEKIEINGPLAHAIYKYLRTNSEFSTNPTIAKEIPDNFYKFLLNRNGKVVKVYGPDVTSDFIEQEIVKLIDTP